MKPEATDRWFVHHGDDEGEEEPAHTLDVPLSPPLRQLPPLPSIAATMRSGRRSSRVKLAVAGGAAVAVIVGCVVAIAGGRSASPAVPLPTAAVAPAVSASRADSSSPAAASSTTTRSALLPAAKPHLRAVAAKRPLIARSRRH
jgi:hypothetical protein